MAGAGWRAASVKVVPLAPVPLYWGFPWKAQTEG